MLNRLFAAALTSGKRVRSETAIGSSRVSVPSVAVNLALEVLGGLTDTATWSCWGPGRRAS